MKISYETTEVELYEAVIIENESKKVATTIIKENLASLENAINVWLSCGKYSVLNIEKVQRQQVKLAV
jgi:hypothetical protein